MEPRDHSSRSSRDEALDRAVLAMVSHGGVPLPPYPAVALRVQEVVRREDFGLSEVERLVSADAALAADVLRCANSPLHRRGPPVNDLGRAIARVGAREVMRLALTSGLATYAQAAGPLAPLRKIVWIEGLASAVLCQELARLRRQPDGEAYVAGLLHDFGKVIACSCLEPALARGAITGARSLEEWREAIERNHVRLGREVADRWDMPPLVKEIIAAHHDEPGAGSGAPALLDIVKASDQIFARLGTTLDPGKADLADVPLLDASERDAMAQVIERIPGFVAAFDRTERQGGPRWTVAPGPVPRRRADGVSFGVEIRVAGRVRRYDLVRAEADRLEIAGAEPLPEGRLLEASIQGAPNPFDVWVLSGPSRADGHEFEIELRLYAPSSEVRSRWNDLLLPRPSGASAAASLRAQAAPGPSSDARPG